jgi:hypothetical protein
MGTQTRIGLGGGAFFTIAGFLAPLIGWWATPIMVSFLVVALWGFWPLLTAPPPVFWPPWKVHMRLRDAAVLLYGKTRGTEIAVSAEGSNNNPSEILNWYAYWITQHGVRLYGEHPPSTVREHIPSDVIERFHFMHSGMQLKNPHSDRDIFEKLLVRRGDLISRWTALTNVKPAPPPFHHRQPGFPPI